VIYAPNSDRDRSITTLNACGHTFPATLAAQRPYGQSPVTYDAKATYGVDTKSSEGLTDTQNVYQLSSTPNP